MPVTKMTLHFGPPARRKPQEGDRKLINGVMHVRRQEMIDGCYHVRNGRPVFEWTPEDEHPV